jgi:heat shock protein HslJ
MRKTLPIIFMMVTIAFTACKSSKKSSSKSNKVYKSGNAIGNYKGNLPCADCNYIDYELNVKIDGTYEERSLYAGKATTQNYTRGKWKMINDSTLRLDKSTAGNDRFEVEEDGLWLLDVNGKRIPSANSGNYKLQREAGGLKGAWREKFEKGIDFLASGNEPSWYVEIDFEKQMFFKSLADNSQKTTPVPIAQITDNATIYSAVVESGFLTVTINNTKCTDNMSGEAAPYSVTVEYNNKTYKGCGRYFYDERLSDTWTLKTYKDGKVPEIKKFKTGLPTIDFNIKTKKISGMAGCNSYTGNFEIRGSRIDFGPIGSTKMSCKGINFETEFLKLFSKDVHYEIKLGELYIYDAKEKAWLFTKSQ